MDGYDGTVGYNGTTHGKVHKIKSSGPADSPENENMISIETACGLVFDGFDLPAATNPVECKRCGKVR